MNHDTDILHEAKRLRLLAAVLELQHYTSTEANVVLIPGGDRVIVIGTPAQVRALVGADLTQGDTFNAEDLDEMEAVARAAPACWYGTYQIVDGISDEKAVALIEACSPDTVLTLIAQARAGLAAAPVAAVDCGGTGKYGDLPCLGCDACPRETVAALTRCAAGRDGECGHAQCPQLRDGEPRATGRHCPIDSEGDHHD